MPKIKSNIYTVLIGGQAGDGIHEAAINLGEISSYSGFEVF